jgi:hypothetical protein
MIPIHRDGPSCAAIGMLSPHYVPSPHYVAPHYSFSIPHDCFAPSAVTAAGDQNNRILFFWGECWRRDGFDDIRDG